jgi:hypothetical protein
MSDNTLKETKGNKENLFASLLFNVVLPIFILSKFSAVIGAKEALLTALAFPFFYAIYDYIKRKQANPISILGFVSTLIKGVFALYKVDGFWFAVQEAAIPCFLGLFTILSAWFQKPIIRYFLYNEDVFNIPLLDNKLKQTQSEKAFQVLIWQITMIFGCAFFLGGILNYFLAIRIIVSPAGTAEFNKELAQMTFYAYMVVLIPKLILSITGVWWFIHRLKKLTGLSVNEILKEN